MKSDSRLIGPFVAVLALLAPGAAASCGDGPVSSIPEDGTPPPFASSDTVPRFGIWELEVVNDGDYENPFDFREIELRGSVRGPDGDSVAIFGFYDGEADGSEGGLWRLRFRPDEAGRWTYTYRWSDGTPGGEGEFVVEETGALAPLAIDPSAPWYFRTARGDPFHFRGYDLHVMAPYTPTGSLVAELSSIRARFDSLAGQGYNFTMLDGAIGRRTSDPNLWEESWWEDGDPLRFDLEAWRAFEQVLDAARRRGIHVTTFAGMVYQREQYAFEDFQVFLRYWIARLSPFANFLGYSPTWEWGDIWEAEEVDRIMRYVREHTPYPVLLSVHDCSDSRFVGWLSFSMRQKQARTVFDGNGRHRGQGSAKCDASGGVAEAFEDAPIVGSEDVWEAERGQFGHPRNAQEVRRAAWGEMLAGVLPLYSEWHPNPPPEGGEGQAEPEVRRMFDFFYEETRYREYRQLNNLVSRAERQAAAGIPGQEYLVYDEDGGEVRLDLTAVADGREFSVLWFDAATGERRTESTVRGGFTPTFTSPFGTDAVLLLRPAE